MIGSRSQWSRAASLLLSRVSLIVLTLVLGAIPALASSRDTSQSRRSVSRAVAARVVSLNLRTTLRLVGRPGHVNNAKGTFTGTFSGTTTVRFVAAGSTGGEATFTLYPASGGSLIGHSVTHGRVVGPTAYFSGTASITGGTGSWAHAYGTGLAYSGTLDRQNYHSTSVMRGSIRA